VALPIIEEKSSGRELRSQQFFLVSCCYCKHIILQKEKAYLLFRVTVFGDFRVFSEDNIVAIFHVTTAVLLNIFGLLDTLLKALEYCAISSCIGTNAA
jgi:hypothetical protein